MPSPSPELLLAISPPVLRALVAAFGPVAGLRPNAPARGIVRAIFEGRAPAKLSRVLAEIIARFASEAGRRAIVEAAYARRDPRADEWLRAPPGDVAVKLAIESATAKGKARRVAERLFALAGLRLERELGERGTYELLAATPVERKGIVRALERELGPLHLETWTHEEPDGVLRLAVFLRAPTSARLVLENGVDRGKDAGGEAVPRVETPVTVDLVRVDATGARVSFTLARPELLPAYARALDLPLRPSFTLRLLHAITAEALARVKLPRGVERLTVVALRWRRPDGSRHEVRAFDALDPAHDGTTPRSGYVDRATLRIQIGARAIDVFLQLPHRLEISDPAFEPLVREVLAAIGVLAPGAMPDDARSLAPYEHGDWRWRSVVRDAGFAALMARKLLVRAIAAHVVTEEHRMHGAGYVVRYIPGEKGAQYALAEDRSLGARLVTAKDRIAWRLDLKALEDGMRKDLGASPVPEPNALKSNGVLDLGVVALPSGKLRFVYAMASPPKGWELALVRACGIGVTPVVLVPNGHAGPEGMLTIGLDVEEQLGVKRIGRVLGKAAEALNVGEEVEPWRRHEEDLVLDAKSERVWIRGVLIALTEKPYRFLEYLAGRAGHLTTTKDVGSHVSSSGYPDVAARRTKVELEKQMTAALRSAGADAEIAERIVIVDGRKGYRLGVSVKLL